MGTQRNTDTTKVRESNIFHSLIWNGRVAVKKKYIEAQKTSLYKTEFSLQSLSEPNFVAFPQ